MAEPSPEKIPRLTLDRGEDGENRIDRLSSLPECALLLILSILDLKEAVTTTVLVKSLKDIFLQLSNIEGPSPAKILRLTLDRGEDAKNRIDRLSSLPKCVLLLILSFLDLKEVVTTTILAKSLKDLFLQLSNIEGPSPAKILRLTLDRGED